MRFASFGYDNEFAPVFSIYGWALEEEQLGLVRLSLVKTIQEQVLDREEALRGISLVYFNSANLKHQPKQKNRKKIKGIELLHFK